MCGNIFGILLVLGISLILVASTKISLEKVVVVQTNPEYIKDVTVFTARNKRGDSYKTNLTITTKHVWANNITGVIYYQKSHSSVSQEIFKARICDLLIVPWVVSIVKKYTNIPEHCPFQPETYQITHLELSPKNFPLPLPEGNNYIGFKYIRTDNSQLIVDLRGTIHVK